MDDELYDEFGNYVGPELTDSDEEAGETEPFQDGVAEVEDGGGGDELDEGMVDESEDAAVAMGNAIVLPEEKQYYPDVEEVFGEDTEALVEEEDAQPVSEPILSRAKVKRMDVKMSDAPMGPRFSWKYLEKGLLTEPALTRNVAVCGHLHHGKTALIDWIVEDTHDVRWSADREVKFSDTRLDEQKRGISIKATPLTVLLQTLEGKSYGFNLIDTPGHPNFLDEVVASMRLCDGVIIVIDALEGVMVGTEKILRRAVSEQLDIVIVISKVDRLILEVKIPPTDAYFKIKHTIHEINEIIGSTSPDAPRMSPELGNVCFASARHGWLFSLEQFASIYIAKNSKVNFTSGDLSKRLWGEWFFDAARHIFVTSRPKPEEHIDPPERSFVEFILEPLYKLYSVTMGNEPDVLLAKLESLRIADHFEQEDLKLDVRPLLKLVLSSFFGHSSGGLASMLVGKVATPTIGGGRKASQYYMGPSDSREVKAMRECDPQGPLVVLITKLLPDQTCDTFLALGRVMSGAAAQGDQVRVLGDTYDPENEVEDQANAVIESLFLPCARYRYAVEKVYAGQLVLFQGVDSTIGKGATLVAADEDSKHLHIFRPMISTLRCGVTSAVVRVAVEPLRPSELPRMVEGLRMCNKTYPGLQYRVEDSGEHVLMGPGELFMDCVLHDLRSVFAEIEIKVSDPCVPFFETVSEISSLKCFAESPNKKNKLTFVAEPLEEGLADRLEEGIAHSLHKQSGSGLSRIGLNRILRDEFGWDALAVRNLWAIGPDPVVGPNCLIDDVLPGWSATDRDLLEKNRVSIVQGFQWATREGPLCDEPVRGLKCRILEAIIADTSSVRNIGQLIPTARRVTLSAFLTASPRLMEPTYYAEIMTPADKMSVIYTCKLMRCVDSQR
mmetsp:Transcript_12773/g.25910  ORF Transcript_12773/g.25910 Transcript_12773/m.25910 type:complete len:895 (-) Transcript_12773:1417-4101(-)